jgi:hypothetical protein
MFDKLYKTVFFVFIVNAIMCIGCLDSNEDKKEISYGQAYFNIADTSSVFSLLYVNNAKVIAYTGENDSIIQPLAVTDSSVEGNVTNLTAGKKYTFEILLYDSLGNSIYSGTQTDSIIKDQTTNVYLTISESFLLGIFPVLGFRIRNEISGWSEDKYQAFDVDGLFGIINGGAEEYKQNGLVEGIKQIMKNGPKTYDVFVMDFATPEKAQIMFNQKKNTQADELIAVGSYPQTTAVGVKNPLGGAISAFAYFGKYYFEISLMGIAEQDELMGDADLFLQFYQAKL